jgi:PAS domain-containing protein
VRPSEVVVHEVDRDSGDVPARCWAELLFGRARCQDLKRISWSKCATYTRPMGALARLAAVTFGRHRQLDDAAAILAQSGRAMMIVDGERGKIIQANASAYELFGPPLVGATLDRVVPERHQPAHREHRRDYMQFPVARPMGVGIEVHAVTTKDRGEVLVEIGLTPIPASRLIIVEIDPLDSN